MNIKEYGLAQEEYGFGESYGEAAVAGVVEAAQTRPNLADNLLNVKASMLYSFNSMLVGIFQHIE